MAKTEINTLIETFQYVRGLSKFYISKLDKEKIHKQIEVKGVKFNTAYWLVAHLVWTEHFLIIQGIANQNLNIPWLEEYGFGSSPDEVKTKPDFDEILKLFDEVHAKAIEILKSTTDEQLNEPNHVGADFGKSNKKEVLIHAIRHEPMHIGQISWILKANKVKMV